MNRRVILNAHFPGEPIGYKRVTGAHRYVPELMRVTQANLRKALEQIAPGLRPSNARFGVQQVFHLGPLAHQRHEPDGDNLEKLLWDAFNAKIWNDDSQIEEWQGRKALNSADPHTHLIAYVLEP
jgi:Holliday junction resolvase RusA-like endonuclease